MHVRFVERLLRKSDTVLDVYVCRDRKGKFPDHAVPKGHRAPENGHASEKLMAAPGQMAQAMCSKPRERGRFRPQTASHCEDVYSTTACPTQLPPRATLACSMRPLAAVSTITAISGPRLITLDDVRVHLKLFHSPPDNKAHVSVVVCFKGLLEAPSFALHKHPKCLCQLLCR